MRKFMLYSFHKCAYIGSHLGYETREEAERVAQNLSTKPEFWYTEIGIYQLVSKAKLLRKAKSPASTSLVPRALHDPQIPDAASMRRHWKSTGDSP